MLLCNEAGEWKIFRYFPAQAGNPNASCRISSGFWVPVQRDKIASIQLFYNSGPEVLIYIFFQNLFSCKLAWHLKYHILIVSIALAIMPLPTQLCSIINLLRNTCFMHG